MTIRFGKMHRLRASARFEFGLELTDEQDKVLLPAAELKHKDVRVGDNVDVFIYADRAGKLAATVRKPKAMPGSLAVLEVVENNDKGCWLDWGLHRQLRVAPSDLCVKVFEGDYLPVIILADPVQLKFKATNRIDDYLEPATSLEVGEEVELIAFRKTPLGYSVIVNESYEGLVYNTELKKDVFSGDRLKGWVKKQREDGKLDIQLTPVGYENAIDPLKDQLLKALKKNQGFLPLHDKSSPEDIKDLLGMSKRNFKMTLGGLWKEGLIEKEAEGIRLR